jgi:hypothetical protein
MQFDLTRPNTGRMMDYVLGGSHNFEIDRQVADEISRTLPMVKQITEDSRKMVGVSVQYFFERGIHTLIDFGASLPTCDNTHIVAHKLDPEMKVVYSDIDPITVAYAQDLLRDEANVIYLEADAATPHVVLDSPRTRELLGEERRVGIVYLNLPHQMSEEQVRSSWQALYDWAAPGSCLAVSAISENWPNEPDLAAVIESYRRSNIPGYYRTRAQMQELLQPWKLTEEGIRPNTVWASPNTAVPPRLLSYFMIAFK